MAVTVSGKNYTQISSCDTTSSGGTWSTGAADSEQYKEGVASLSATIKNAGLQSVTFTPSLALDLSGIKHLRMQLIGNQGSKIDTLANGGIRFWVSDGTNTGYYYVAGSDTYQGGWINLVADLSRNVDSGTKPTMTAITTMGFAINLTSSTKNAVNTWWDNLCICDGLIAYGDDAGSPFGFQDIQDVEDDPSNGGWGVIRKIGGVYFITGEHEWGDSSSTNGCDFKEEGQVVVYEDRKVNSGLYKFSVVGNITGITKFQLGAKSGTQGISGCVVRVQNLAQAAKFNLDFDNANIDTIKLYGSTFLGASMTNLPIVASSKEALNCSWESCGEVIGSTCVMKYSNFISANNRGLRISSTGTSHNKSDCNFISCGHGVHIDVGGELDLNNMKFSGNTYDIENSTSESVVINNKDGSDATTYENTGGGSTTINTPTTHSLTGLINGSEVTYVRISDTSVVFHVESVTGNETNYNYNWAGDVDVYINIMHLNYNPITIENITLTNTDSSIPVQQVEDPDYYNPT